MNCTAYNLTRTCSTNQFPIPENDQSHPSSATCPEYFRWIHEDLRPWARTGITQDMVERAKETANFKLVILKGKAYLETYEKAYQTRDVFSIWGILQLLRRYPGKIPDLELTMALMLSNQLPCFGIVEMMLPWTLSSLILPTLQ